MSDDPLLTVRQAAQQLGLAAEAMVDVLRQGGIISLDEGRLVSRSVVDIPLIRRSQLDQLAQQSSGAHRIDVDETDDASAHHPAFETAFNLIAALAERDAERVASCSTRGSLTLCGSANALANAWERALGRGTIEKGSLTTAVYELPDHGAVAVRLVHNPLPFPIRVDRPTPMPAAGAIPLVMEDGEWRADLQLMYRADEWIKDTGRLDTP